MNANLQEEGHKIEISRSVALGLIALVRFLFNSTTNITTKTYLLRNTKKNHHVSLRANRVK
jgi:hypothetical protein